MKDSGQSFYDMIMNDAQELMEKQASAEPEALENILNESDLSESDLSKIASQLDEMLANDTDDSDEMFEEEADNEATGDEDLDEGTDPDPDPEDEEENTAGEELSEEDLVKLAEYYDELGEKYASEDRGVADYVYDQLGNPEDVAAIKLATMIGESAEKLAYVTEISPYAVADDLLTAVASNMMEEDEDERE